MGIGQANRIGLAWATVGMLACMGIVHVQLVGWIKAGFSGRDAAISM